MEVKLLEHNFAQLATAWNISRHNVYSDRRKEEYHAKLQLLYDALAKDDFSSLGNDDIVDRYYIILFVFRSLEFLDKSTINLFPFETAYVLNVALEEYVPAGEHLIVTSLVNSLNHFSFDSTLTTNNFLYDLIKVKYGIEFNVRLIQINLPNSLSRDYLAHAVLYHELGHFIEHKFEIVRPLYEDILFDLNNGKLDSYGLSEVYQYFPYLVDKGIVAGYTKGYFRYNQFGMHIAEYFCDLFAAQYVADAPIHYLNYVTLGQNLPGPQHPSTTNRIEVVKNYIAGKHGYLIDKIITAHQKLTGKDLKKKYVAFGSDDFLNLIPIDINSKEELHYLFIYGWNTWLSDWKSFQTRNKMNSPLKPSKVYEIINSLLEKSIGNYIVQQEWNKL